MRPPASLSQILEVVCCWDTLRFTRPKEVFLDWICVVAERNFDGAFKAVQVAVIAGSLDTVRSCPCGREFALHAYLVCLMFLHQRNQFLGGPALGLEVIVIRCRSSRVHLYRLSTDDLVI